MEEENKPSADRKKSQNPIIINIKKLPSVVWIVIAALVIAGVVALVISITSNQGGSDINAPKVDAVVSLKMIKNVKELSTFTAVYNAVARRYSEEDGKVVYYVSYSSKVRVGIDLEKIDIRTASSVTEDGVDVIEIIIPKAEILDVSVDMKSLDYIFMDNSYNKQGVSGEAYSLCEKYAKTRSEENNLIKATAEDNAVNMVKAFVEPLLAQQDGHYKLEVKIGG